jgi:bisphosphoglycerate-dependent phosphoglycerate mutase
MPSSIRLTEKQYRQLINKKSPSVTVTEGDERPEKTPRTYNRRSPEERLSAQEKKQSDLFLEVAREAGWECGAAKSPCSHRDASYWHNKPYNVVIIWNLTHHYAWCLCEIMEMSRADMEHAIIQRTALSQ